MRKGQSVIGACLLAAVVAASGSAGAPAGVSGPSGVLAYVKSEGIGSSERSLGIYVMTLPARKARRVTAAGAWEPVWSPDGRTLAYTRYDGILLVSSSGGRERRLTRGADSSPTWSPDGLYIAFSRSRREDLNTSDVWIASVKNGTLRRLTDTSTWKRWLRWAPLAQELAFEEQEEQSLIRLIDMQSRRTRRVVIGSEPAWSPTGRHLAFSRDTSRVIPAIYAIDMQTRKRRTLVGWGEQPSWSPNGRWIAYISRGTDLYVQKIGTTQRRLLLKDAREPAWKPASSP